MIENTINVSVSESNAAPDKRDRKTAAPIFDESDIKSELGVWLSGLESFLAAGNHSFVDPGYSKISSDSAKEFRLTHSTLLRCAKLNSRLLNLLMQAEHSRSPAISEIELDELDELSLALRDCVLLSDCIIRAESLGFGEWKAWCNLLSEKFARLSAFQKLIRFAEASGGEYLPEALKKLAGGEGNISIEHAELSLLLPRFGRILKWLSVIGRMLEVDEPLKPALLIFSRVNEQISELISYINNRLERFPNEEVELFASLDAASYTASIELKKVYTQELAGLARLRPSPSIYARMETAHSLLNESFQQILAGFAGLLDQKSDVFALFPNFQLKFEQSLVLRQDRPQKQVADARNGVSPFPLHRIGLDRQRPSRRCIGAGHPNAGVERYDACFIRKQRIDVDLADLGVGDDQGAHLHQGERDRVEVRLRPVAVASEQVLDAGLPHHVAGEFQVERRQCLSGVAQHFDCGAASAEHQHRAEGRVIAHADEQFMRARAADHRLHGDACDARCWMGFCNALKHFAGRGPHRFRRLQSEPDAADIRLVGYIV